MTFRLRACAFGKSLHNSPAEYLEAFDDRGAARVDPVMQHCKHSSTPIVYGQGTYVGANLGAKWEHQAPSGLRMASVQRSICRRINMLFLVWIEGARCRKLEPN